MRVVARVQVTITLVANQAATKRCVYKDGNEYFFKIKNWAPTRGEAYDEFDEAIGSANLTGAGEESFNAGRLPKYHR